MHNYTFFAWFVSVLTAQYRNSIKYLAIPIFLDLIEEVSLINYIIDKIYDIPTRVSGFQKTDEVFLFVLNYQLGCKDIALKYSKYTFFQ